MKLTGNPCLLTVLIVVSVLSLISGQFFTKTSKSIPRMGRRSEIEPVSKASLLQAIYGQSEATIGNEHTIKDDQEIGQPNNPEYQSKGEKEEEDERLFEELTNNGKEEPEYTSIVIRNLKKVLRAYARKHRDDDLTRIN